MEPTFYIAADYARRAEVAQMARQLEDELEMTSHTNWITPKAAYNDDATGDAMDAEHQAGAVAASVQDFNDIQASSFFIQLSTGEPHRGGRTAELGVAIAMAEGYSGRHIILVGPREHVFHFHPAVTQVPSFLALRFWLAGYLAGYAEA